jgi:tetratricopeptide (TPR) repeat protein
MLGSRPAGPKLLPFETTHAHNFFIHHWVELGILGLLSALSIFVFPAAAVGWELLRSKGAYPIVHNVLLIGLVCVLAGRLAEQMVGVAKLSDSLIFWVVLAILVNLATVMSSSESSQPPATRGRRRGHGRTAGRPPVRDSGIYWRCAVVVLLIGGIVVLTWVKNVNNLRALNHVAGLNQAFINGNLNDSVTMLNRAIERAPDVYQYHTNLGTVYSAYRSATVKEPDCNLLADDGASYEICLARKMSEAYAAEVAQSSWRWRSRLDLAEAELDLFRLTQDGDRAAEAVRLYRETAAMMPHSWKLRNQLAQMLTAVGDPEESLLEIEKSLAITGSSPNSADAMLLKGKAYNNVGNAYVGAGQYQQAVESYDEAIRLNPGYALAYNNRGGAYVQLGQYEKAIVDYGAATRINPLYANAYFNRAVAYAQAKRFAESRQDLTKAVELGADGAKLENLIYQLEAGAGVVQSVRP